LNRPTDLPLTPTRISVKQHQLRREDVDANAVTVTDTLTDSGFQALLVGGCVRDLLLGAKPKDFDVATSATPEQVRALFRRSRLVGRRFRIAHVRFGRGDVIEVSTFRRFAASPNVEEDQKHSEEGLILRDNVYGTLEEDAFRRDFTVNALYYDPRTEEVLDFVDGLGDLAAMRLRCIGESAVRLREDPVRLLRALRFQAKLGFELDPEVSAELADTADRLAAIAPARLFDEIIKMLLSGYAERAWQLIDNTPIRHALFPNTLPNDELVHRAMANTDARIAVGKPVTPGFLLAVLMWPDYIARSAELREHKKPAEANALAAAQTLADQQKIMAVPRRFSQFVRDVWGLQRRLEDRHARNIQRLAQNPRFRAGYDFLLLRAEAGEGEGITEAADWWTNYQDVDEDARVELIKERQSSQPAKRKRRRRRSAKSN
jgi:poly(A) polymerase